MFENVNYIFYSDTLGRSAVPSEADFNCFALENKLFVKQLITDGVIIGEVEEHGVDKAVCMMCEEDYIAYVAQHGNNGDENSTLASESVAGYSCSYDNTTRNKAIELNAKSASERKYMWISFYCNICNGWRI